MKLHLILAAAAASALITTSAHAAALTWNGSAADGDLFRTPGNWTPAQAPTSADDVTIGFGAVQYVPANTAPATGSTDLAVKSLTLTGGSFTQPSGAAFMQFGGRSVTVTGGAFSMGTSTGFVRSPLSTVTVSGGTMSLNNGYNLSGTGTTNVSGTGVLSIAGSYAYNTTVNATDSFTVSSGATFNIGSNLTYSRTESATILTPTGNFLNGGTVNVTNEFKPLVNYTMNNGTIVCKIVSFGDSTANGITLTGGTLSVDYDGTSNGFFGEDTAAVSTTGKFVNFVGTGGTVILRNSTDNLLTAAQINTFVTNNFRFNGVQGATPFNVVANGTSLVVTAVPEPTTLGLAAVGAMGLLARRRK